MSLYLHLSSLNLCLLITVVVVINFGLDCFTYSVLDMEVVMGLPVEGLPVIRKTNLIWEEECEHLLGVKPPSPIPKPNQNKSVLDGTRIKSK